MRSMVFVLFALASLSVHAADVAAGKATFAICSTCHGPNAGGNQSLNAPRLVGLQDWYLKRQLQAFKAGIRGMTAGDVYGAQMRPMAMTLANDAAIDNVVAYVATLTAPVPAATVATLATPPAGTKLPDDLMNRAWGDPTVGKQLYATCAACHGPKGEGNTQLNAPRLADQDDWYLVRQLQNFKRGIRGSDPKDAYGAQMKPMAAMLANDQAINNVVVYIGSLK